MIEGGPSKLWESELSKNDRPFSNRVSAINNSTKHLLQSIDIWDTVSNKCKNVNEMKVWGNGSKNIGTVFTAENEGDNLAYIVENDILIAAAMNSMSKYENLEIMHNSQAKNFKLPDNEEDGVSLTANDNIQLECNLLLGTDGANSKVRQAMGTQYISWDYKQRGIVATLKLSQNGENDIAWQKFLCTGPIALLPLDRTTSSLVWTTTPEQANFLLSLTEESFVDALNSALWEEPVTDKLNENVTQAVSSLLKKMNIDEKRQELTPPTIVDVVEGSRASFPLGFGHAVSYISRNVALVGDAAHRVHPLAGQGVNLGFGDVACLSDVLARYASYGAKYGDYKALQEYETIRQRSIIPKLIGIDLIQKVAGHQWSPLLALTNVAMQITNAATPLKKLLIKSAAV
ncbi:ubiquinone biosynthesis monooxygenase COQ6, mitochondrial isoform X2 [Planococcus citri]